MSDTFPLRRRLHRRSRGPRRRGAILVLVLLLLLVLLAAAAFSVDVAYMQLTRTQLRNATDSSAMAGAEALLRTKREDSARQAAKVVAEKNLVSGKPVLLEDKDIVLGQMVEGPPGTKSFVAGKQPFDTVRVHAEMSDRSKSGSVGLFFGRVFHNNSFSPQLTAAATTSGDGKRDICVVVDRSGSMNGTVSSSDKTKRWNGLLQAFDFLVAGLNASSDEEQLGLTSYEASSTLDEYLTPNYSIPRATLHTKKPGSGTNIYSGIKNGTLVLTDGRLRKDVERVMVVMTDGLHNTGPEPIVAAREAKGFKIRIITITFGANADTSRMRAIAELTGGKHYHAPTAAALQDIFRNVGSGQDGVSFAE